MAEAQYDTPSARPRRVLLAENDPDVRTALHLVLERKRGFLLVGQCQNACELLRDSAALRPDVILLDLELRGLHLDHDLAALQRVSHGAVTVALSTRDEQCQAALRAGATAFVCKGESPLKLLETLDAVSADRTR